MKVSVTRMISAAAIAASVTLLFPGCFLGPKDKDTSLSSAQFAADEVSNMGVDAGNLVNGAGLNKSAAVQTETTYVDRHVTPYRWDAASESYVRAATFSTSRGYDRTRVDTVAFTDESGNKLQHPTLATVKSIHHYRHVTHSRGGEEANVVFDMTFVVNKGTDTTLVKNGTISGTYGDETIASGTVSNVTRYYKNGYWQFPESGNISATFPRHSIDIQYLGNGQATATIHNLVRDKVTITNIQVDQR
jgi:hypothetical protein